MTTPVTAADLAVGDFCEWSDGRIVSVVLVGADEIVYQMPGGEMHVCSKHVVLASIARGSVKHTPAPSPIPHPAALKDLYEACKAVLDAYAVAHPNWSVVANQCEAAIRKAGGEA